MKIVQAGGNIIMTNFQALILGIIQGLTEFLPVSSSGHLVVLQNLFGIEEGAMLFTIAVHLGTLAAVILVFRKQVIEIIKNPLSKKTTLIIIATIPTLIIAFLINFLLSFVFNASFVPFAFIITAIILIITDFQLKKQKKPDEKQALNKVEKVKKGKEAEVSGVSIDEAAGVDAISYKNALGIGIAQGIAVIPGLSRSGATICAGIMLEETRENSTNFSFLLSIPIILASMLFEVLKGGSGAPSIKIWPLLIGIAASFISGLLAIKFMLKIIKRTKLSYFAIYLVALSIILILF
jgi:undecaprenyl-diphosphatase